MAILTLRMLANIHNRLKSLAKHTKINVNKLMEGLSTQVLAEFDSEIRFKMLDIKCDKKRVLELLNKLDKAFDGKRMLNS